MSEEKKVLQVGLVMPISPIDGCSAEHWSDVRVIIDESVNSIENYKCDISMVSEGHDVGVIQKRIVRNLYQSDIVICDVSCKNANVMFELGMRLAFDKPTVIVKDELTDYSFDTGVIEHLIYPRDLRFNKIVEFKELLAKKVIATYVASTNDPDHSPFLKEFGSFKAASLQASVNSPQDLILELLTDIQKDIYLLKRDRVSNRITAKSEKDYQVELYNFIEKQVLEFFLQYKVHSISELSDAMLSSLRNYILANTPQNYLNRLNQEEILQIVTFVLQSPKFKQ